MKSEKRKMQRKKRSLRKDERAVSPVIGVILMVAITVVMAAIIGAFVYGYAGTMKSAPSLSGKLEDYPLDKLESGSLDNIAMLTITSGDNIPEEDVKLFVTYTDEDGALNTEAEDGGNLTDGTAVTMTANVEVTWTDADGSGDISTGDKLVFTEKVLTEEVKKNTNFRVQISHITSGTTVIDSSVPVH